jgi:Fe-S-cluster containining protein
MEEIERLKEEILKNYPRLTRDDSFSFECRLGVPCFNDCCGDVNIFLTPYDIIRLKKALGLTSGEFLSKHTISPFDKNLTYPVILLKMEEDEKKSCPFVTKEGCRVYADRPWSCRMYPLGLASPREASEKLDQEFYFLLREAVCRGYEEGKRWTVSEWLEDQGIREYDEMGEHFKDITLHRFFEEGTHITPEKLEMFFLACYDIDRFREFLFGSSFFEKFEVDLDMRQKMQSDDVELLHFGYRWLRFALFGEKTLTVKNDVLAAKEKELAGKLKKTS